MSLSRPAVVIAALSASLVGLAGLAACGDDGEGAGGGGDAAKGQQISIDSGCGGCHGRDGEGTVGPPWVGLYGAPVQLEDGATVTADDAYLRQAITDPAAQKVTGFPIAMPPNQLTPEQVDAVVAYIRSLADAG